MAEQQMGTYFVDIVMCIDGTYSMKPVIEEVKANALALHSKIVAGLEEEEKHVEQLRIKVIVFRDYGVDSEPMKESDFFVLPDQNAEFESYINGIEVSGGGDAPENALEAISLAMQSNWTTEGYRQRHIIVLFTDAPAHPLGKFAGVPSYPVGIPASLDQLLEWWDGDMQGAAVPLDSTYKPKAGRLIIFAPDAEPWPDFATFDRCWSVASKAGAGCEEVEMKTVVDLIKGSV